MIYEIEFPSASETKYSPLKMYYSKSKKDYVKSKTKYCAKSQDGKWGYWDCCGGACSKCCPYANKNKLRRMIKYELDNMN